MLARELAEIIITKPSTDQWGFNDTTNVTTLEALSHFSFRDTPDNLQLAGQKAFELLKNSPYKDKLATSGLFLKQLDEESKSLPALINPRLGNRVVVYDQLMGSAPQLESSKLDQISALPIGARVKLDPWSDRRELLKAKPVPLLSAREKMPFEVTPFMPFLVRYEKARFRRIRREVAPVPYVSFRAISCCDHLFQGRRPECSLVTRTPARSRSGRQIRMERPRRTATAAACAPLPHEAPGACHISSSRSSTLNLFTRSLPQGA